MNDFTTLEQQLTQLGDELSGHSDLGERVLQRLAVEEPKIVRPAPLPTRRRSRWQATAAVAASVMLCLGVWWMSRPATLHARMLAALAKVDTVHITGWSREIVRKWPLEKPSGRDEDEKYDLEAWFWTDPTGTPRSYDRQGPVIAVRRGGDLKEYQKDADLTFVFEGGYVKDRVAEFGRLADYLTALQRPSLTKEELGRRLEGDRWVRGIRHIEGDRIEEIWIDEKASLPVRMTRKQKQSGEHVMALSLTYDEAVPEAIAAYEPPETKYVRHGGGSGVNEEWRRHVEEVVKQLEVDPIEGRIAVLPRKGGRTFANQWALPAPNGKYWVRPLDVDQYQPMTLSYFVRRHAATEEGERRHGTWRMPEELHEIKLPRSDLVHEADVPWQEWVQFVLNEQGLEFVDQIEDGKLWIAKHDGRELKPWRKVKPPVPYVVEGGVEKKGYVKPGIGFQLIPATISGMFADFNRMVDQKEFAADKPWIVDETGLPAPPPYDQSQHGTPREYWDRVVSQYYAATDSPWFVGHESLEMAKEWYAKEFGITFTEEVRPVTVHVIRRKQ